MSNVLLVDTNFSSGPIYHCLIEAGHKVTVVGGNPNDALAKCADDYVNLNYSNIEQVRELIKEKKIEYLVPGCNDRSYMVCAEINADGRFPGIDSLKSAGIINNKEKFRAFSSMLSLPAPYVLTQEEIGTRWPVIVKPVDAFSGRGVTIIHEDNKIALEAAISLAQHESKSGKYIVEDYVEGQLHSHTAFLQNSEIIVDHIVEEHGTANHFTVDTSRVVYNFPASMLARIRENIRLLAKELNLQDGLVHTQFIRNGEQYWLIEITRRCPGDLYSQLIELSTGLHFAKNYTRPFIGMPFDVKQSIKRNWVMRHTLTQSTAFTLGSLTFNHPLKLIKWIPISLTGDKLHASPHGRIAVMFVEESNEQALDLVYQITLKRQLYEIKP
jgi:formate-dependent phosphoribosylglycinamide formyltransferase (GAR transformylase)